MQNEGKKIISKYTEEAFNKFASSNDKNLQQSRNRTFFICSTVSTKYLKQQHT